MFGSIGPWELILILCIALIVFGPGKLPQAGEALGNAIREFKKASSPKEEKKVYIKEEVKTEPEKDEATDQQ